MRRALLAALLFPACRDPAPPPGPPNFLIVDIDSMNADMPWAEADGRPLAPALLALAAEGVSFPRMQSQGGWTLPALVSLLTGAWPPPPVVDREGLPMFTADHAALPDVLELWGYHTVAFWGRTAPSDFPALLDAFDESVLLPGEEPAWGDQLLGWIEGPPREPFFALVHQVDLYRPQPAPPDAWLHRGSAALPACAGSHPKPEQLFWRLLGDLGPAAALTHFRGHMEGALGHYDTALAGLFEALGARDLGSRTVVMVLSNHGNDLLAHGVLGHNVPFQTVLQVPLIVRDPAATARGATRPERVRTMDVAPTILARAGIPAAASMDGRSFLPLLGLSDEPWAPETAFSLTNRGAVAVLDGDLKLLRWSPFSDRAPRAGPAPEGATATALFDLAADPGETADLAGRRPEEAAALGARLDAWLAEREAEARTGRREPVTPALQQALQERGYWGVVQETPTPGPQGR